MRYGKNAPTTCSPECLSVLRTKSRPCGSCNQEMVRKVGERLKDWSRRKFCSLTCAGAAKSAKNSSRLPRVYGPDDCNMSRSECAAELTKEWGRVVTVDEVEAIERRALGKLYVAAQANLAIRELMCLAS